MNLLVQGSMIYLIVSETTYQPALQQFQRGWSSNPGPSVSQHAFEEGEREERGAGKGSSVNRRINVGVGVGVDKKEVDEKVQVEAKKCATFQTSCS